MSARWEQRVWRAHPLAPADRLVLLAVARAVPDGTGDVLLNRAALARELEATAAVIARGLRAAEAIGVARVLPNGRISFIEEGMFDVPVPEHAVAKPVEGPAPDVMTTEEVLKEFGRQWAARYGQRYVFAWEKDRKTAKTLATHMTPAEIRRRVAAYLAHPDPFYAQCAHAFGVFATAVNKVGASAAPSLKQDGIMSAVETREYLRKITAGEY